MAVLALATSLKDLRDRFSGWWWAERVGEPVTADDLGITGALTVLMRDTVKPNPMQTWKVRHLVHAGPWEHRPRQPRSSPTASP